MNENDKVRDYLVRLSGELHDTRIQLRDLEAKYSEPVAIVGMACRLPGGVTDPDALWQMVAAGREGVSGFPTDRGWELDGLFDADPASAGTSYSDQGGFLHDAANFDAGLFGISPREALGMDPQQRLLLETSWEALEHAGIDPSTLNGNDVGVFSGVFSQGYGSGGELPPELEGFVGTGVTSSVVSGRVSYVFGLEGPAVSIDTACSSSLVAIHLASHALRQRECSMALAGGATVMATPGTFVGMSRQGGLAADGRCKSYADAADGTGWAEGAGVVVLERLSVARERGHRVLAVVRGSAVNQDGASNGLTAPNGPSQQRVIRKALAAAGLSPADVDVVDGHGTGTVLGDPIEAQALLATYGRNRDPEQPLWLGSLKSNIGHTQAAAGVAGVIKMVQALRHEVMPATLHVDAPTAQVDWSAGAVELLTEARKWPRYGRPRRAGVSGFGVSGTNAHLILEEAPDEPVADTEPSVPDASGVVPLIVSGASVRSLSGQAGRLAAFLDGSDVPLPAVARALATQRAALSERAVVVAGSQDEAVAGLWALADGESHPAVITGGSVVPGRVVLVFPGQGSQWAGMGAELLDESPVFAQRIAECAQALEPWVDWSLEDVLRGNVPVEVLDRVDVVQPASFAVMVGLAAVWESAGVRPDAVLGHSQGEIAAASVAGALSLQDAARVVAVRSQLIAARLAGRGGMASVALPADDTINRLERWAGRVEVATINSPTSVVIAGDAEALDEALAVLQEQSVRVRRIAVDYASHTGHVDALEQELLEALAEVRSQAPRVGFLSTVTGEWVREAGVLDGGYWYRNLRSQVRFGPAVADLLADGYGVFVEASAHPVLVQPITETVDEADVVVTGTLRRQDGCLSRVLASMAQLFVHGISIHWAIMLPAGARTGWVDLPTYAFDHQHYWLPTSAATDAASLGLGGADHPLIGAIVSVPQSGGVMTTSRWSLRTHPWLADHTVGGVVLLPGAGLVELAVRAGDEVGCGVVEELVVEAPLVIPQQGSVRVQVIVGASGETSTRTVEIYSAPDDAGLEAWTRHAIGTLTAIDDAAVTGFDFAAWPPPGAQPVDVTRGYELLAQAGYGYGPVFRGVRAVWRRGDELFAEVALPPDQRDNAAKFGVHPALLDAALHPRLLDAAGAGPAGDGDGEPEVYLPFAWTGLRLHAAGASALRVRLVAAGPETVSLQAAEETGGPVLSLSSLTSRRVSSEQLSAAADESHDALFRVEWIRLATTPAAAPSWVPVATAAEVANLASPQVVPAVVLDAAGDGDALDLSSRVLGVVQAWLSLPDWDESRLVVVTRGAMPAGDDAAVTGPAGAAVWGLVRAGQAENPDRIVLLDLGEDSAVEPVLGAALASGEPQLAAREVGLFAPRLVRAAAAPVEAAPPALCDEAGTVLVTGGTGALGVLTARHLVARHRVRHLILASRRGPDADGAAELVAELAEYGATVSVIGCDVTDRDAVRNLLARVPAEHPLTGVVHTAGVLDDGVIDALTPERLAYVFGPKVTAAQLLDELTRRLVPNLKMFVVFSSAAGLLGSPGQGNYAAANTFLDALMSQRRAAGLPGVSLAWGFWEQNTGLTVHLSGADRARMSRGGVLPISSAEGVQLFDAALAADEALMVPAKLDLMALRAQAAGGNVPPLLRGLVPMGRRMAQGGAGDASGLAGRLAGLAEAERQALLLDLVRGQAAIVLGHAGSQSVQPDTAFRDAGFDSLTSVELRNRLREITALKLPATLVFDYPTPTVLTRFVLRELGHLTGGLPAPSTPVAVADLDEPIAVVGMACRLPGGVADPDALWRLVAEGGDGISGFPTDRGWDLDGLFDADPSRSGTSYTDRGSFLDEAGLFDPRFFGISPREALAMDPQQRLLLETSWEALEHAGIDPVALKGSDGGVFSGVWGQGYGTGGVLPPELEGFAGMGSATSVVSGRVSYVLGLEGPAVSVDTACSSSLVAIHLAVEALRRGECSMALAGGATVMATPAGFVEFSRQRGLAADGRCKSYAEAADGTGWGEGAGVLVLERLSVARAQGHRVLAVVRGSAVNQDGASNGLTAPNGPSQQRVIRKALAVAGLSTVDVDVVEGHGTGTVLGDPIEAQALLASYGRDRDPQRPLWLGSLKSNIGHTQAAAGVAGVIKMVQALRHEIMPATLNVDEPSSQVDWSAGAVELLTEARAWPRNDRPRRAGVSAFGVSGTNAHLILEEAPPEEPVEDAGPVLDVVVPLVVSARSAGSLGGQAGRLASFVDGSDVPLPVVAHALVTTRAVFPSRAVVVAESRNEALAGLNALALGEAHPTVITGGSVVPGRVVLVFPGQGSQWVGMGAALLDESPVFAQRIAECADALGPWVDWSLEEVLRGNTAVEVLDRVDVVQPASFAVMVGLAAVWESAGVRPDAVIGHSQGEIAAACVAGALSLPDAARVVAVRSQLIAARLAGRGGMASVALPAEDVINRLERWAGRVEVATINSPTSVVIAGDAQALDEALAVLQEQDVRVRRIAVDYASHTGHVEVIEQELAEALAQVGSQAPTVGFLSTVTGEWVREAGVLDGGYWYRNLRSPVRFGPAVAQLLADGYGVFVEASAHPVLVQPVTEVVDETDVVITGTLRRRDGGLSRVLASMAQLFVRGVPVDWAGMLPAGARTGWVDLPTYAFDHQRYWLQPAVASDAVSLGQETAGHPLLGAVVRLPSSDGVVFTSRWSLRTHPWLADHAVGGVVLLPGSALVELAVRAGDEVGYGVVEELVIEAPLVIPQHGGVRVQVVVGTADETGTRAVDVYSVGEDSGQAWVRHASGTLSAAAGDVAADSFDFGVWPPQGAQRVDVDVADFYTGLQRHGYAYGPVFQGVQAVWQRGDELFAEVAVPPEQRDNAARFGIHPALLDAALQSGMLDAAVAGTGVDGGGAGVLLPFAWTGLRLHAAGASGLRVRLVAAGPDTVSLQAADQTGGLVLSLSSLTSRPVSAEQLSAAADDGTDALFRVEWTQIGTDPTPAPPSMRVTTADEVAALADQDVVPAVSVEVAADGDDDALALSCRVLTVVQAWLALAGWEESRLVVITRGAVPAGDAAVTDPAGAAAWGLVRAAQAENPDRILLLDLGARSAVNPVLGMALAGGEPQLAARGTTLYAPRLARAAVPADVAVTAPFDETDTVLVTGGTGSLGALVARHLVTRHGVRHLILASRRGPDADGAAELVAELTEHGAEVSMVACDVTDRDAVAKLLAAHPLTGVVHTAGLLDDGVISALTPERMAYVFAPKVTAVRHLDELTRRHAPQLKAFVVFSSAAGLFGSAGQGNYAAANTFLDALMTQRRAAGLPGVSLAWGLWEQETGLTAQLSGVDRARMSRGGALPITPAEGMQLFDAALAADQALMVPVKLDLRALRAHAADDGVVPALLRGLIRAGRRSARSRQGGAGDLADRLAGLVPAGRAALLLDLVRAQAATVLGHAGPQNVEPDVAFRDAGFDSLTSVELRNRLREITGLKLPATLVFDYPSPTGLARYLFDAFGLEDAAVLAPPTPVVMADPDEPIALVGMACRLPGGVADPEGLWRLVAEGRDTVSGFPTDRGWELDGLFDTDPARTGTSYTDQGCFVYDAAEFDAAFFGISPREALGMDPQQRLLLETSWEALEHAGINPAVLKGTDVGVFSGVWGQGYGMGGEFPPELEGLVGTSVTGSVVSGRVSYVFGLEGPAVSVDTACSSSLVAIHLAVEALRRGECSMALAGGATVMATPAGFVEFSRQRGLAADGRCKSYAEAADGTGWGEGAGVLVLERLSQARAQGHRVLAVVRGSAVNQDGASNGLTAPNGPSQQRVIRKALAVAGLSTVDVDVVEGHGTGTVLGDPIEAQALLASYGRDRDPQRPLWLGSLKSNIGHTQAAAGVAGVIKMVQALRHEIMPATLNVDEPSSQVDWSAGAVELLTEARAWPRNDRPRRAGVSAFGVSGTNAHLILEEAPPEEPVEDAGPVLDVVVPLVVSARSAGSLGGQAGRLASFVDGSDVPLPVVAHALVTTRAVLPSRAVVVAESRNEALAGLNALALGEAHPTVITGGSVVPGRVVLVFPGQGSQWVGMGAALLDESPVFAQRIAECADALGPWVDWSLEEVLRGNTAVEVLDRVDVVQPASFAVMVGLAAVWESAGVRPDAVIGHSQGEIAAACVAGALSLPDAARVVAVRSQLIAARLAGRGGMASVALPAEDVINRLERWAGRVEVATINSPTSVVIAGDAQALDEALAVLQEQDVRVRRIAVDYASHTGHVEVIEQELAEALTQVRSQAPTVGFLSTVTGEWVREAGVLDGGYWYRNLRSPVRFGPAVAQLLADGYGVFVEASAHPVLVQPVTEVVDETDVVITGTLRRRDGGLSRVLASMAQLFVRGIPVDWAMMLPAGARTGWVDLPTYAFDHQRYWLQTTAATDAASLGLAGADHPLIGAIVNDPHSGGVTTTSRLSLRTHPWLADHAVGGVVLLPGSGLVELAVRAGDEVGCGGVEELVIEAPLVIPQHGGVRVQVVVGAPGDIGTCTVDIYSAREEDAGQPDWTRHATGTLTATVDDAVDFDIDFAAWPPADTQPVDVTGGYDLLAHAGYAYGPAFRSVQAVWRRGEELFAEIALPQDQQDIASRFGIHPALLDSALHPALLDLAVSGPADNGDGVGEMQLPFAWTGLQLHAAGASALRVRLIPDGPNRTSLQAADETGGPVLSLSSLNSRPVSAEQLSAAASDGLDALFRVEWQPLNPVPAIAPPPWSRVASAEDVANLADHNVVPAVLLHAAADGDGFDTVLDLSCRVLEVVQTWLALSGWDESRLVVVTRGAVPAGADAAVTDLAGAAVWGLVRAAQAENPDRFVLLDLETDREIEGVLGGVLATGEPQAAARGTVLFTPRLVRAAAPADTAEPALFDEAGTVLVTGGTGALGALIARHLVAQHGIRRLTLASRRGPDAECAAELVAELSELGAEVSVVACDMAARDAVTELLTGMPAGSPLTGVVHTAGVLDDGVIGSLTPDRLEQVFGPKVAAAHHMDELTRKFAPDLKTFVVFSSAAGLLGSPGQGNYAAANAFLDGLMVRRRAAGLPGVSLAWGLWEQNTGMTIHLSDVDRARMSRGGVMPIAPAEGLQLFDAALAGDQALVVPVKLDLRALRREAAASRGVPVMLRGLVRAGRRRAQTAITGNDRSLLIERLAGLSAAEQVDVLLEMVCTQAAVVLGHGPGHHIEAAQGLFEIGFDSLTALELRNRLGELTGAKLPPSFIFDYPTPKMIAEHLRMLTCEEQSPVPAAASALSSAAERAGTDSRIESAEER